MTFKALLLLVTTAVLALSVARASAQAPVTVVEYYNKSIAAYFLTGRSAEQAALDTAADFERTGVSFSASSAVGALAPLDTVCRYRIAVPDSTFSSHFYGLSADCALIASLKLANFSNEGFDFAVERPTAGVCPASSPAPVYRALRKLTPVDVPNHRYSVTASAYQQMLARGWIGEGIVFCSRTITQEPARALLASSSSFAARCEMPRAGASPYTGVAYPDRQGTLSDEKNWLASYSDETYLWYREIPKLNAANFATTNAWFAALKTPALALSGAAKDRFHFTESTDDVEANDAGVSFGYGIDWSAIASAPPRRWLVAVVTPGSPAAAAGVKRGDSLVSIDGADFRTSGDVATLINGLSPSTVGSRHNFVFAPFNGSAQRSVSLTSASVAIRSVPASGVISSPSGRVGYIAFTTFNTFTAEKAIADAISGLVASGGVSDLVLDLRYNGGGYVFISAETAFMIAGQARTANKIFELYKTNEKKPFGADDFHAFYDVGSGVLGGVTQGQPLPSLNLGRVFVLTQAATCSASESVINGLRGVDVEVILIGSQTCGKPYGFQSTDNCGVTYSTIQFTGVNNKGDGDYIDGFAPTCKANDDLSSELGNPAEGQLAAALSYRATRVCAPVLASSASEIREPPVGKSALAEALTLRDFSRRRGSEKLLTPKLTDRSRGQAIMPMVPLDLGAIDAFGRSHLSTK